MRIYVTIEVSESLGVSFYKIIFQCKNKMLIITNFSNQFDQLKNVF